MEDHAVEEDGMGSCRLAPARRWTQDEHRALLDLVAEHGTYR